MHENSPGQPWRCTGPEAEHWREGRGLATPDHAHTQYTASADPAIINTSHIPSIGGNK